MGSRIKEKDILSLDRPWEGSVVVMKPESSVF